MTSRMSSELREFHARMRKSLCFAALYCSLLADYMTDETGTLKAERDYVGKTGQLAQDLIKSTNPEETDRLLCEVIVCRIVQDFEYYAECVLQKMLSEGKARELSHKGFPALLEALEKNLGLSLSTGSPNFREACEFYEVRNLITHHGGRVSHQYLKRTGNTHLEVGREYPLNIDYVYKAGECFRRVAIDLDKQLFRKR